MRASERKEVPEEPGAVAQTLRKQLNLASGKRSGEKHWN